MSTIPFEHLLAAYAPRAQRAALGWLGDEQEAREATQDALFKAFRARDRYDQARPFYPWLRRIVRNHCFDLIARRKHAPSSGLDTDRVPSSTDDALEALSRAEAIASVQHALQHVSEAHREILVMRHFEDLSYAEMAEALGVAEGTVMSRLYRARKALLDAMESP